MFVEKFSDEMLQFGDEWDSDYYKNNRCARKQLSETLANLVCPSLFNSDFSVEKILLEYVKAVRDKTAQKDHLASLRPKLGGELKRELEKLRFPTLVAELVNECDANEEKVDKLFNQVCWTRSDVIFNFESFNIDTEKLHESIEGGISSCTDGLIKVSEQSGKCKASLRKLDLNEKALSMVPEGVPNYKNIVLADLVKDRESNKDAEEKLTEIGATIIEVKETLMNMENIPHLMYPWQFLVPAYGKVRFSTSALQKMSNDKEGWVKLIDVKYVPSSIEYKALHQMNQDMNMIIKAFTEFFKSLEEQVKTIRAGQRVINSEFCEWKNLELNQEYIKEVVSECQAHMDQGLEQLEELVRQLA